MLLLFLIVPVFVIVVSGGLRLKKLIRFKTYEVENELLAQVTGIMISYVMQHYPEYDRLKKFQTIVSLVNEQVVKLGLKTTSVSVEQVVEATYYQIQRGQEVAP